MVKEVFICLGFKDLKEEQGNFLMANWKALVLVGFKTFEMG